MEFFKREDCDVFSHHRDGSTYPAIMLEKANRLLRERGVPYFGHITCNKEWIYYSKESIRTCLFEPTHKFLIIPDDPIEQDSAEKVLSDLLDCFEERRENIMLWQDLKKDPANERGKYECQFLGVLRRAKKLVGAK